MKNGEKIVITPLKGASQRTRNRIHERGGDGFTFEKGPKPTTFSRNRGALWILVHSYNSDWSGWLPIDEIEVTK